MAIALRAAQGSNNAGGNTSITMTVPTGTTDGDVMAMAISVRGGTGTTITLPAPTWTAPSGDPSHWMQALFAIGGIWVAGTGGADSNGTGLWTATDPTGTWTAVSTTGFSATESVRDIVSDGTTWVAVGELGRLTTATDPTGTWTSRTSGFGSTDIDLVAYGDGVWVAAGESGKISSTSTPTGTWTSRTSALALNITSLNYANGYFVACDGLDMAYSSDGITWTDNPSTISFSFAAYSFTAGLWYASEFNQNWQTNADPSVDSWTNTGVARGAISGGRMRNQMGGVMPVATSDGVRFFDDNMATVFSDFGGGTYEDAFYHEGIFMTADHSGLFYGSPWVGLKRDDSTTVLAQSLYYKVALSEPASYDVTITSNKASGVIIALSGADLNGLETAQFGGQANASSANITSPATSGFTASDGIDVSFAGTAVGTTIAPDTTGLVYTEPANGESASTGGSASTRTTTEVSYRAMTNVTSAADVIAVASAAAVNIGHHIFIKDAIPPAGAPGQPVESTQPRQLLQH